MRDLVISYSVYRNGGTEHINQISELFQHLVPSMSELKQSGSTLPEESEESEGTPRRAGGWGSSPSCRLVAELPLEPVRLGL